MAAALGDGAEETPAGGEIFLIGGEVGREVQDALGQGGGLVIGTAGVLVVKLVILEIDVLVYSDAAHFSMVVLGFRQLEIAPTTAFRPFGKWRTVTHPPEGATGISLF